MMHLVCLGAGPESVPILERLAAQGDLRLIVVDANPDAPGFALAAERVVASCYHVGRAVEALEQLGRRFDGVLCCGVDAPHVAAGIAWQWRLPGLHPEDAALSVDKLGQIVRLQLAGLPVPEFGTQCPQLEQAHMALAIKPIDSRGARGVQRLPAGAAPGSAWAAAIAASPNGRAMWEQWLDGPQYSTESIIMRGRVRWTGVGLRNYARLEQFAPAVIEDGYDWQFSEGPDGAVSRLIGQACQVLGWDNCTVKGDLVLHAGRWHIIELAARMAGGYFAEPGHRLATRLDFTRHAAELALGLPSIGLQWEQSVPVSQRYVFGRPGATVRRLPIVDNLPGLFHRWHKAAGYTVPRATSHADRLGMVMCWGDAAAERAEATVAQLEKEIVYE